MPKNTAELLDLWRACPIQDGIHIGSEGFRTFVDGLLVDGGADSAILGAVKEAPDGETLWRDAVDVALGGLHDREDGAEMADRLLFMPVWGPVDLIDQWLQSGGVPALLQAVRDWISPHVENSGVAELDLIACPVSLHPASLAITSPDALRSLLMGFVFHENVGPNVAFSEPQGPATDLVVGASSPVGVRLIALTLSARMNPGREPEEAFVFFNRIEAAAEEDEADETQDTWFRTASHHGFPQSLSVLPPAVLAHALTSCVISRLVSGWNIDLADRGLSLADAPLDNLRHHITGVDLARYPADEGSFVVQAETAAGPLSPVVLPRAWAVIGSLVPVHLVIQDLIEGVLVPTPEGASQPAPSTRPPNRRLH